VKRDEADAMTTIADVKKAVAPLLAAHDDLALVGRMLVIKPIHHILRGVHLDRTSSKDDFIVQWAAVFLFDLRNGLTFNWGHEIYCPSSGRWTVETPDLPHLLKTSVEHDALPTLWSIQTIADFVEFASVTRNGPPLQYDRLNKLLVDAAVGNFESCDALLAGLRGPRKGLMAPAAELDRARILRDLAPRIDARDRAGIAALLHEWEAWSVKAIKLEKYWERTPFPVELDG
jgi:hypothetical protein